MLTAIHKFFSDYGTSIGFILYTIQHLVSLMAKHHFHVDTWELAALLATAIRKRGGGTGNEGEGGGNQKGAKASAADVTFHPVWKKPTMRCLTLANWFQVLTTSLI